MAIKITDFGGTDWTDGEVLNADDLIDTIIYTKKNFTFGITPTQSGWNTAPTNLTNITDEDEATYSTDATITAAGPGYINFDLGALKKVDRIFYKIKWVLTRASSFASTVKVETSPDNSNWTEITSLAQSKSVNGTYEAIFSEGISRTIRYIRIRVNGNASDTNTINVYCLNIY
jgi:hypothetical protein